MVALAGASVAGWAGDSPEAACKMVYTFPATTYPGDTHPQRSGLFVGHDGKLHGVTPGSVAPGAQAAPLDVVLPGTAFRMTAAGKLTLLAVFADEGFPYIEGQIAAHDGNYYGTTLRGGLRGSGTVYRMTPHGRLTTLFDFPGDLHCSHPGKLMESADGVFYGVGSGYAGDCAFKVRRNGDFRLLRYFDPGNEGQGIGPFIQASDGRLHAAAASGGRHGQGTLIAMQADGSVVVLHAFQGGPDDGAGPRAESALIEGPGGWLYGLTTRGGTQDQGTFYRVSHDGSGFAVLHSFAEADGISFPVGDLLLARDGRFYGVMTGGGAHAHGGVYRLTPSGELTLIQSFGDIDTRCGAYSASSGLTELADGEFYGTNQGRPSDGHGGHWPGGVYRVRVK